MIDKVTLEGLAGEKLMAEARDAFDLNTITAFKFDARGRLEAGVKPAPPSKEPAAYIKITRRGSQYMLDCARHGKGGWCLHAVILALHHLGEGPIRRSAPVPPRQLRPQMPASMPAEIGFQLCARFDEAGAKCRLRALSTGNFVTNPLRYLGKERAVLKYPMRAMELLQDLGEAYDDHFAIARTDLAPFLRLIEDLPLWDSEGRSRYEWKHAPEGLPELSVDLGHDKPRYRLDPVPAPDTLFIPGRNGYLLQGLQLTRYPGPVPDWQMLLRKLHGAEVDQDALLETLLREKHLVSWRPQKPELLQGTELMGLKLSADQGTLFGQAGLFTSKGFFPLKELESPRQWLQSGTQACFWSASPLALRDAVRRLQEQRVPWQGASFRLREGQAKAYLERFEAPRGMHVETGHALRWFGQEPLEVEVEWRKGELDPYYRIGGELFSHRELAAGLLPGGRGIRMAQGRLLNIDCGIVAVHQSVLESAKRLHRDPAARASIMRRMLGMAPESKPEPREIDPSWSKRLRGYQGEGLRWLLERFDMREPALLADDMGLGKTIQTLAFLEHIRGDGPQLIVVPTSLMINWKEEAAKFSPKRRVLIHHGPRRTKDAKTLEQADLIVASYGVVLRDAELFEAIDFQVAVLDEAQTIKNADSQTAQAVCRIGAQFRMALTGTPIENRLLELWSIFDFLAPGLLGPREAIAEIRLPGTPAFQALRAKLKPFLMRRLKSQVASDLPEKQEITIKLPLNEAQATLYTQVLKESRVDLKSKGTMAILTKLLRLRQVCCHPGLCDETQISQGSTKFDYLLDQLETIVQAGESVLVFSQFTELLKFLRYELEERELGYLYLDGQTKDRQGLVHRFQEGEQPVFLISLKAGGTGLNLTRASYVFHLDPWWNPMVEAQATDRAHRIGQSKKVVSYKLIAEGTIEEKILTLQSAKRFVAEGLWEEPETLFQSLDQETLLQLLTTE